MYSVCIPIVLTRLPRPRACCAPPSRLVHPNITYRTPNSELRWLLPTVFVAIIRPIVPSFAIAAHRSFLLRPMHSVTQDTNPTACTHHQYQHTIHQSIIKTMYVSCTPRDKENSRRQQQITVCAREEGHGHLQTTR